MKLFKFIAVCVLFGLLTSQVHAQLNPADLIALTTSLSGTTPTDAASLPAFGNFYSALNPYAPPFPGNLDGLPAWNLGASNLFLLDDIDYSPMHGHSLAMSDPSSAGDGGSGGGISFTSPQFDTNGLWLQITNTDSTWTYLNLNNATNQVYVILSKTDMTLANWSIEQELWPTNATVMPFSVAQSGRSNLFLRAMDWTGVTENGNLTPDWWFFKYFGMTALSDTNLDGQGNTLLSDYQGNVDPNIIAFSVVVTNNYFSTATPNLGVNITAGTPSYYAVSVDDTNYATDSTWLPYTSTNIVAPLGLTEGWHSVWVGLKGMASDSTITWQWKRLKTDFTPPTLVLTNPTVTTVTVPLLQVQGYSAEELSCITYDITNASGFQTNLDAFITSQFYSTNTFEFTTNYFQCVDVLLTNGLNIITLHARDRAGNVTTTNFSFTLDNSTRTNPPVVNLYWPQTNTLICNSNYSWRGWVDDPTATVVCQQVDTNGVTNLFNGIVERDGKFWVENIPMTCTNYLTLVVTDSASNTFTTNITVSPGVVNLTIDTPDSSVLWNKFINVTGTIDDTNNYTVWVNGVKAVLHGDNTWAATNVYLPDGGTALIQGRAIPNSNNGGNGTGGSGGGPASYDNLGNPDPPQDNDAELQVDKPTQIIQTEDHYQYNIVTDSVGDGLYVDFRNVDWIRDTPYDFSATTAFSTPSDSGYSKSDTYFPASPEYLYDGEDSSGILTETEVDNGITTTFSGDDMYPWSPEIEKANKQQIWGDGTYHYIETPKLELKTGGKGRSRRRNLFKFHAIAQTILDLIDTSRQQNVPPDQIVVLGQTLDENGNVYRILPDNITMDISADVSVDDYTYAIQPSKYLSYFTIFVQQANPGYSPLPTSDEYDAGHVFWQISTEAPDDALAPMNSGLTTLLDHCWGFYPTVDPPPGLFNLETVQGVVLNDDDHSHNIIRVFAIGIDDAISGLEYTKNLKDAPPDWSALGFNCTFAAQKAGFYCNVSLPYDITPQNFGVSLVHMYPGPFEDDTIIETH